MKTQVVPTGEDAAISADLTKLAVDYALRSDDIPLSLALRLVSMETSEDASGIDRDAVDIASHSDDPADWLLGVRQACAMLKKNVFLREAASPELREERCITKFLKTQKRVRIASKRLNYYLRRPSRMPPLIAEVIGEAQADLFRLLGPGPEIKDWRRFADAKSFSNGVIQGLKPVPVKPGSEWKLKDTSSYGKLNPDNRITSTSECLRVFGPRLLQNGVFRTHVEKVAHLGYVIDSAAGMSVFKEADIDRFIAAGGLLNSMAQQGIRSMWDPYLKRWGITLDQQERNRELAERASHIGLAPHGWSTVDLSSASDGISVPLVHYLLPKEWARLCDAAREPSVRIRGKLVKGYSSYCTMGNAFTFPLQCLIFASLVRSSIKLSNCDDREYRVYGDDIICPSSASLLLVEALKFCGFTPNLKKTHITGFFRESCGGDFVRGLDVNPVELTEQPSLRTTQHVLFNRIQRKIPSHPVLYYLLGYNERPFVGLAVDRESVADGYFEGPPFVVAQRGASWYCNDIQAVKYRFKLLAPHSIRVKHDETDLRHLMSCLLGNHKRYHDLRGSVKYRVRERTLSVPYRIGAFSPVWYA